MHNISLPAMFLFALGLLGGNGEKKAVSLEIKGMTCSGCVKMIEASLEKIDGVAGVEIDLEKGAGIIQYDASKVKEEAVVEAVEKAGGKRHSFQVKRIKEGLQEVENNTPACCKVSKEK